MAKHTEGKWATSEDGVPEAFQPQVTVYDEESSIRIATVFQREAIPLIAAAPDLLEACKTALGLPEMASGRYPTQYAKIEAAVKKAEGK